MLPMPATKPWSTSSGFRRARRPRISARNARSVNRGSSGSGPMPSNGWSSAASLRPRDERALYRNVIDILSVAVERRGSSIDDYTAPDGDGEMQEHLDVYQRTGQPCRRCGRPIRRIVIGIRATHFCSFCQRLPAADRPGAAKLLATVTPRPGRVAGGRRGRRWVDLDGEGVLGRTPDEGARARERTARTKAAAATRRAAARRGAVPAAGTGEPRHEPGPGGDGVDA